MKQAIEILKNIGIGLAVVVALANLWDWSQRHKMSLVAEIEYGTFALPADYFTNSHFQVLKFKNVKTVSEVIFDSEEMKSLVITSQKQVDDFIKDNLNKPIGLINIPSSYSSLKGLYIAKIHNKGDKALVSIAIKLPQVIHYMIERETGETKSGHAQGLDRPFPQEIPVITIDSIAVAEELTLYAWSYNEPNSYLLDDITIRHSEGMGEIKIRSHGISERDILDYVLYLLYFVMAIVLLAFLWPLVTRLSHRT